MSRHAIGSKAAIGNVILQISDKSIDFIIILIKITVFHVMEIAQIDFAEFVKK